MRTKYVADDGTEFTDCDACERYEARMEFVRDMVEVIREKMRANQDSWSGVDITKFVVLETFNYMMDNKDSIRDFI